MDGLTDERFGLGAESAFDASSGAEEVGDDGVAASLHLREEERRAAALDDTAVDFGEFEVGVNFRPDFDEVTLAPEQFEKRAEVAVHAPSVNHTGGVCQSCAVRRGAVLQSCWRCRPYAGAWARQGASLRRGWLSRARRTWRRRQ